MHEDRAKISGMSGAETLQQFQKIKPVVRAVLCLSR